MSAGNIARFTSDELLEAEEQDDVLVFLARVRPMDGIMYDGDERLDHGRELVCRWLAASSFEQVGPAPESEGAQVVSLSELAYECAEVIYFLRNLDPLEPRDATDAEGDYQHAFAGQHRIFDWIERRLVRGAGFGPGTDRPHKSAMERLEEANATARAIEERQTQGALQ